MGTDDSIKNAAENVAQAIDYITQALAGAENLADMYAKLSGLIHSTVIANEEELKDSITISFAILETYMALRYEQPHMTDDDLFKDMFIGRLENFNARFRASEVYRGV